MNNLQSAGAEPKWHFLKKVSFRFFFIFFILYIIPFPLGYIEGLGFIYSSYTNFLHKTIPWVGTNILQLENAITIFENGSTDTTYNFVLLFSIFSIAVLGTLIWSIIDRSRLHYNQLYFWLSEIISYYLGYWMLRYGFIKVFGLQFQFPELITLSESYGDSPPMNLVWMFMGYSKSYSVFAGLGEIIGGLLVFHRRTRLLGAVLLIFIMSNVVMLNFSYDIPVKIASCCFLIMALFISAKNLKGLLDFFILHKPINKTEFNAPFINKTKNIVFYSIQAIFVLYVFSTEIYLDLEGKNANEVKPPFYGIYEVDEYKSNGKEILPLVTDDKRWSRLIIEYEGQVVIRNMKGRTRYFGFEVDSLNNQFTISEFNENATKHKLNYQEVDDDNNILINGVFQEDTISVKLRKKELKKYALLRRRFNWVIEYPYKR